MPQTNPQVRELYDRGVALSKEAQQILLSPGYKASEDEPKVEDLNKRAEGLFKRSELLANTESRIRDGAEAIIEQEREEREALRSRAEAAAGRTAAGARGVEQTTSGEQDGEDLEAEARVAGRASGSSVSRDVSGLSGGERRSAEALEGFSSLVRDMLVEVQRHDSPEARNRRRVFQRALTEPLEEFPAEDLRVLRGMQTRSVETSNAESGERRAHGLGSAGSLAILVPEEVQRDVRLATLAFGGFRNTRATFLSTSHGRKIPIPTINDTSNEGSFRGEHESIANATDVSAEPDELGARLLRSGVFLVGYELAQDMPGDSLETLLVQLGTIRNERRAQRAWTTDAGGFLPKGVMEGITTGTTATAADAFEPSDWFELFESVDSSYHAMGEVMLSNNGLTKLKVMDGGIGQGLWQPGLAAGQPAQIDGHNYEVNFSMDTVSTGNKPAIFGDLSWMYIREVVPTVLIIYREKYAPDVGYELVTRTDSRPVNPGVPPFKALVMA